MRLLLDENIPKKLKQDFSGHEVFTVREMGWTGISNGKLLELMTVHNFDALITFDQNLQHQQNFKRYTITVFVFIAPDNTNLTLKELVPMVSAICDKGLVPGPIEVRIL